MCEAAAGAHPGKRREVEDSSKKLGALFWKLNKGEESGAAAPVLSSCGGVGGAGEAAGGRWRTAASPHLRLAMHPPTHPHPCAPAPGRVDPAGEVSESVGGKLLQLCAALDAGDFVTATHLQVDAA